MAATAAQEALGKVKAGRAKMEPSPSFQLEAASASGTHAAELRLREQRRGKDARGLELGDLLGGALGGHHAGNGRQIGEAGAVIEGDLPAGDEDEEQRRQAAGEDGGGHLETGDQRHRHRRREHDDDLLQGVEDQFAYRGPLFRQIAEGGVVLELHR